MIPRISHPSLRRTGAAASVLLLFVGIGLCATVQASVQGRVFGDFGIGIGRDDSIYRDSSKVKSTYIPSYLGLGWKGRFSPSTTARAYYRFLNQAYPSVPRERYTEQVLSLNLKQKIRPSLSLLLEADGDFYRQPNLERFNSNLTNVRPGVEYLFPTDTRVRASFLYQSESFPNYDLDTHGPGWEMSAVQDLGLYSTLRVSFRSLDMDFKDRLLYANSAGSFSTTKRADTEKNLSASWRGDWDRWGLQAGYEWYRLNSNGNLIDYGPNQSPSSNANLADDRLINDYYSYKDQGPFVSATFFPSRDWQFFALSRWSKIDYDGRLAKDVTDQFVSGEPNRSEDRHVIRLEATHLWHPKPMTLGFTVGWFREHSNSNDSLYSFTNNHLYGLLRGWF